jgi:hypothetical protein
MGTTGLNVSVGNQGGGATDTSIGLTDAQSRQAASCTGWGFAGTWRIYEGHTASLLKYWLMSLTVTAPLAGTDMRANQPDGGTLLRLIRAAADERSRVQPGHGRLRLRVQPDFVRLPE